MPPVGRCLRLHPPVHELAVGVDGETVGAALVVSEALDLGADALHPARHHAGRHRAAVSPVRRGQRAQAQLLAARPRPVRPHRVQQLRERARLVHEAELADRAERVHRVADEAERHDARTRGDAPFRGVATRFDAAAQARGVDGVREDLRVHAAVARVRGEHVAEEPHEVAVRDLLHLLERLRAVQRVKLEPQLLLQLRIPVDRQLEDADHGGVVRLVHVHHGVDEAVPAADAHVRPRVLRREPLVHVHLHIAVVVQQREDGMVLDQQFAYFPQVRLGVVRTHAAVELGEHAVAAEVRVEEHLGELVPDGLSVLVAAAKGHGDLKLVVVVAVKRLEAVVVAIREDEEVGHEVARLGGGEAPGGEVGPVEIDEHRVGTSERELVRAVNVPDDLAREPERVQALEERFRRLPRTALRRLGRHLHPTARTVREFTGGSRSRATALRKQLLRLRRELELDLVYRVEAEERSLQLLLPVRIVLGALGERGGDLRPHAAEALGEDRAERRDVVHVVGERPAAERERFAAARPEHAELLVGDERLLLVELSADAVHEPPRARATPAAVHAGLEVERRFREQVRHEVLSHREVAFAAHVERVVAWVGGAPSRKVGLDALVACEGARILRRHLVALPVRRIERAQLLPQRRVILRPVGRRPLGRRRLPRDRRRAEHRARADEISSRHRLSPLDPRIMNNIIPCFRGLCIV